jgi:hypothetical protein
LVKASAAIHCIKMITKRSEREVNRANITAIDDELLLEFLHHPQSEAIELTIELAGKLVAAQTPDLVRAMVADLSRHQKADLWQVLGVEERAAIAALMATTASTSPAQAIPQSGGFANDRQEPMLTKGAVVRTLTELIGVIQHVFQSITKPFVVYHSEINRTICYAIDDPITIKYRGINPILNHERTLTFDDNP